MNLRALPIPYNVTGWWEKELGSWMHASTADSQGNFSGQYHTAVSSAQKPIEPSHLVSSQHLDEDGQCTLGFTVNWKKFSATAPPDSTAVFMSQCFAGDSGEEVLQTSWLLREKVTSLLSDWKATR
ncbi:avidin-like [Aquila chrysaetos chrysaetos]|uniref:avidin-like n=1 Tax=Aquila chrysaetos chrysaetos TaxID=223781 RepID=UPI001B7D4385|nr:avidin-like [Aquila chrysaetos chrysaetos]